MTGWPVRGAIRTFVVTTLALFIPGLLGWLNALTEWARGEGSTPFPDAHGLAYLGVSAITAGVVALVQLAWNAVEDASGKGFLRTVPPVAERTKGDPGQVNVLYAILVVIALVVLIVLLARVL
jgi:hypothetical protein